LGCLLSLLGWWLGKYMTLWSSAVDRRVSAAEVFRLLKVGASGAMGLARMGRTVALFDSQQYRFRFTVAIHNTVTGTYQVSLADG
jgi:hypothetical protein